MDTTVQNGSDTQTPKGKPTDVLASVRLVALIQWAKRNGLEDFDQFSGFGFDWRGGITLSYSHSKRDERREFQRNLKRAFGTLEAKGSAYKWLEGETTVQCLSKDGEVVDVPITLNYTGAFQCEPVYEQDSNGQWVYEPAAEPPEPRRKVLRYNCTPVDQLED